MTSGTAEPRGAAEHSMARRLTFWPPRLLALAYGVFLSLFALDIFRAPVDTWQEVLALALHLAPAIVVLGILALAWRRSWVGVVAYPLLALVHLGVGWGKLHWSAFAVIGGPLVAAGILFFVDAMAEAAARRRV